MSRRCMRPVSRTARRMLPRLLMLLALLPSAPGCIAANPSLSGGATTPTRRVDMALGGAARLPTGQLRGVPGMRGDQAVQRSALGEGITPIGFGRYGINRHTDVELAVLGASARVAYRHEWLLADGINRTVWLVSPSFMLGKAYDREADAARGGVRGSLEVPLLYSADYGGGVRDLDRAARGVRVHRGRLHHRHRHLARASGRAASGRRVGLRGRLPAHPRHDRAGRRLRALVGARRRRAPATRRGSVDPGVRPAGAAVSESLLSAS
ncbi:MAG: hypothetical protein IPL19_30585 [Sandaracinaceae bacterium]|nr:hypothetical protein [Sandaracinaceae bacterium]